MNNTIFFSLEETAQFYKYELMNINIFVTSDWVSFLAYGNLFGIKGFVVLY
jgi:hypothetical protein